MQTLLPRRRPQSHSAPAALGVVSASSSTRVVSGLTRFVGDRRWPRAGPRTEHPRLSDLNSAQARKVQAAAAHSASPRCLPSVSATVRVRLQGSRSNHTPAPALSFQSVSAKRGGGEKAPLESSAGGQSTARGKSAPPSFAQACPLRREQVTTQLGAGSWHLKPKQQPREPLSARSGCSVFPECQCYTDSCRCTRRLPNSDAWVTMSRAIWMPASSSTSLSSHSSSTASTASNGGYSSSSSSAK